MSDELLNVNIETCSDSELRALVRQALPTVITFVKASRKLLGEDKPSQNPCDNCDKAETCKEPCELLEGLLPGVHSGSSLLSKTYGDLMKDVSNLDMDGNDDDSMKKMEHNPLKVIDRIRTDEIYSLYKNCRPIFTKQEWRVVSLKIDNGFTYKAIGLELGIAVSTASDTFQRAKKKMEKHYIRQRKSNTRNLT